MTTAHPPRFPKHDPATAEFWDVRFKADFTPWKRVGVSAELLTFASREKRPLVTLIPGCGETPELATLVAMGWDVTAIDFSREAVARARLRFSEVASQIHQADFFEFQPSENLDLIYERAFLCALPRSLWEAWAGRVANLLPTDARLVGFFYFDSEPKGPPFGIGETELMHLLEPNFKLEGSRVPADSNTVFAGKERWMEWRRR